MVRIIASGSFNADSTFKIAAMRSLIGYWRVMDITAAASVEEMMLAMVMDVKKLN